LLAWLLTRVGANDLAQRVPPPPDAPVV
jgi:hypothetical protein